MAAVVFAGGKYDDGYIHLLGLAPKGGCHFSFGKVSVYEDERRVYLRKWRRIPYAVSKRSFPFQE